MINGVHFLLTYSCTSECDHCFLHCRPDAPGTFTVGRLEEALHQVEKVGTVEWVYFEGGEPFLFYPLMLHGIRRARDLGFRAGVVTNCYWSNSEADARLWLEPLRELDLADLSVSDDDLHHGDEGHDRVRGVVTAANELGIPVSTICIERVRPEQKARHGAQGAPVTGGSVMYRGRAVEKLTDGLPRMKWEHLDKCPHEELENPERVHIDPYGHVHLCQGLSMGNIWEKPLASLIAGYDPRSHPICGPLLRGGPAELVRTYGLDHQDGYVDECHQCYEARRALLGRLPQWLAPPQVYGIRDIAEHDAEASGGLRA
ncbi:MAG: hypothetical protein AB1792_06275 [Candidatus Zixiibacteriota bacterium]